MPHSLLQAYPLLARLAEDLRSRPGEAAPLDGEPARAAVAMVLRPAVANQEPGGGGAPRPGSRPRATSGVPGLELLLIQRAARAGDPWSGQVALPGGRWEARDATLLDTALRETLEETGLDLAREGEVLGMLDELRPRTPVLPPIIVSPFVVLAEGRSTLSVNSEVESAFWAPWDLFADPVAVVESRVQVRGAERNVESYRVGERVVWGMTERMVRQLARRLHRLAGI